MSETVDLHQAMELFLLRCDAESTKVAYEREIRRFLAWLDRPEVGCCERYVAELRARGLSPTTVRWRATVAAKFLRSARDQGVLSEDVTIGLKPPKGMGGFAPRILSGRASRLLMKSRFL